MTHEHQQPELLKQTPHIVAFLDFLGAEAKMRSTEKSNDFLRKIHYVYTATMSQEKSNSQLEGMTKALQKRLFCKAFSDNIVIATEPSEHNNFLLALNFVARFCTMFQFLALTQGLFIRGGITYGAFVNNEHFVFGEALVNAYDIEQNRAIYPRIVVDNSVFKQIAPQQKPLVTTNEYWQQLLRQDFDGQWYVSPFGEMPIHMQMEGREKHLSAAKEAIFSEYKNSKQENHKQKYFWLIKKFNEYCDIHIHYQYLRIPLLNCDSQLPEVQL